MAKLYKNRRSFEILEGAVEDYDPSYLNKFKISKKDLIEINLLFADGNYQQAIDLYIDKYLGSLSNKAVGIIRTNMAIASKYELSRRQRLKVDENIIRATSDLGSETFSVFKNLVSSLLYAKDAYDITRMESGEASKIQLKQLAEINKAIQDKAIKAYLQKGEGILGKTSEEILRDISEIQKDLIVENQKILAKQRSEKLDENQLGKLIRAAKKRIKEKHSKYYEKTDGKIIQSNEYPSRKKDALPGETSVNRYNVDEYLERTMRQISLDVDRDREEALALIREDEVIEYYKRDYRQVKIERVICQEILSVKRNGKSILAVTEEAASKFQIMTVDEAKEQGAMGPYCRHSIRSVSKSYVEGLQKKG